MPIPSNKAEQSQFFEKMNNQAFDLLSQVQSLKDYKQDALSSIRSKLNALCVEAEIPFHALDKVDSERGMDDRTLASFLGQDTYSKLKDKEARDFINTLIALMATINQQLTTLSKSHPQPQPLRSFLPFESNEQKTTTKDTMIFFDVHGVFVKNIPAGNMNVHFDPQLLKLDNQQLCRTLKEKLYRGQKGNLHFAGATFSRNKRIAGLVLSEMGIPEKEQTIQAFHVMDPGIKAEDEKVFSDAAKTYSSLWGDDCITFIKKDLAHNEKAFKQLEQFICSGEFAKDEEELSKYEEEIDKNIQSRSLTQRAGDKLLEFKNSSILKKYGKNIHIMVGLLQRQHVVGRKMQTAILVDDDMDNIHAATAGGTQASSSPLEKLHSILAPDEPMFETIGVLFRPYDPEYRNNIKIYIKKPGQVCVMQQYQLKDASLDTINNKLVDLIRDAINGKEPALKQFSLDNGYEYSQPKPESKQPDVQLGPYQDQKAEIGEALDSLLGLTNPNHFFKPIPLSNPPSASENKSLPDITNMEQDKEGNTALINLIKNKAIKDSEIQLAIEQAKERIPLELLKIIMEIKNNDGTKAIYLAATTQRTELSRYLLKNFYPEIDTNIKFVDCCSLTPNAKFMMTDEDGDTELHRLVMSEPTESVIQFLQKVAPQQKREQLTTMVNTPNNDGFTPLHIAIINCRMDVVQLLVEGFGADLEKPYKGTEVACIIVKYMMIITAKYDELQRSLLFSALEQSAPRRASITEYLKTYKSLKLAKELHDEELGKLGNSFQSLTRLLR